MGRIRSGSRESKCLRRNDFCLENERRVCPESRIRDRHRKIGVGWSQGRQARIHKSTLTINQVRTLRSKRRGKSISVIKAQTFSRRKDNAFSKAESHEGRVADRTQEIEEQNKTRKTSRKYWKDQLFRGAQTRWQMRLSIWWSDHNSKKSRRLRKDTRLHTVLVPNWHALETSSISACIHCLSTPEHVKGSIISNMTSRKSE